MLHCTKLPTINNCDELRGGFKKSPKSEQSILEERRQSLMSKHSAVQDSFKIISAASDFQANDTTMSKDQSEVQLENKQKSRPVVNMNINPSLLGDLTGTRPAVSKYSLNRYSLDEWRQHNKRILDNSRIIESNILDYNAQTAIMTANGEVDKINRNITRMLKQKAKEIFRWKVEAETTCKAMTKEVELIEFERNRLNNACRSLVLAESIIKECINVRSNRTQTELVADNPENELYQEMELVNKMRDAIKSLMQKLKEQLTIDKAAKQRIEYDWCDKTIAYNTDSENLRLNANSNTIMFHHGAVKYGDYTAPLEYYEYYCRENIQNVESVRQNSADLRGYVNVVLTNYSKTLRKQADKTDTALANTVSETAELITQLEERLKCTLRTLADTEILIQNLQKTVLKMDIAMKLAQTRLDNRNNWRPHGENVRDEPHLGLLQEVKVIHETVTSLLMEMKKAEKTRESLIEKRLEIEKDIASKRKTYNNDRLRCGMIRSHYPSASQLAGLL